MRGAGRASSSRAVWVFLATLAVALTAEAPAVAQTPDVEKAERAYDEVNFEELHRLAAAELEQGGQSLEDTRRLFELLGIANAALGQHEAAYQAFIRCLAIAPGRQLERTLSPRIRAPYLEAKGFWNARSDRLEAQVSQLRSGTIQIQLRDPIRLVQRVELQFRQPGERSYRKVTAAARSVLTLPNGVASEGHEKPPTVELEYALRLLDSQANEVLIQGTPSDPRTLRGPLGENASTRSASAKGNASTAHGFHGVSSALAAVLGAGATAGGVWFHLQREREAERWNGAACERPGLTRGAQCGATDQRRERAEHWAIGLYASGGALFTTSLVLLLSSPSAERAPSTAATRLRCGAGAGASLLHCRGEF